MRVFGYMLKRYLPILPWLPHYTRCRAVGPVAIISRRGPLRRSIAIITCVALPDTPKRATLSSPLHGQGTRR